LSLKSLIVGCVVIFVIGLTLSLPLYPVASQSVTLVTSTATVVSTESYTHTSVIPVASYTLGYTTANTRIQYSWTLGGNSKHCVNDGFAFQANAGDIINGTITEGWVYGGYIVVYLLSDQEFTAWENQAQCDPRASGIGIEWVGTTPNLPAIPQVSVDWTAPVSGQFWVLVETFSGTKETVIVDLSAPMRQTAWGFLYFTQYATEVDTFSQTFIYPEVPSLLQDLTPILMVAVVLAALAIVGYLVIRQKKKRSHRVQRQARSRRRTRD